MSSQALAPALPRCTRGSGLLEPLLARLRARQANRLIPNHLRSGRVLDVGCGSFPYFLSHTAFAEKFAIDQVEPSSRVPQIEWLTLDLSAAPQLPFTDEYFSAVTMLAVVEHLEPSVLVPLLRETHRALKPGGVLIITTPASWSDDLLHLMARLHLVSPEEIHEHVYAYTLPLLGWYFGRAGFLMDQLDFGYFEAGLNMWARATK